MSYERQFEVVLMNIASYPRGGEIIQGTPEYDRDLMIGIAREALRNKYGMAWRERVKEWKGERP